MTKINEEELDDLCDVAKKKMMDQSIKLKEIQTIQKSLDAIRNTYVVIDDDSGERDEHGLPKKIKYRNGVKNNPLTDEKFSDSERLKILNKAKIRLEKLV